MSEDLQISVIIDHELGIATELTVKRGSSILELRQQLVAGDITGGAKLSDVALSLPSNGSQPCPPLPDSTKLAESLVRLQLCEPCKDPPHSQGVDSSSPGGSAQAQKRETKASHAVSKATAKVGTAKVKSQAAKANVSKAKPAPVEPTAPATQARPVHAIAATKGKGKAKIAEPQGPSLMGVFITKDTGDTKIKGVSRDGRYVFAYVGSLTHPHDLLAIIPLFQGTARTEDLHANRARYVFAGGTLDKQTSIAVMSEVIIEVTGL